MPVIDVVLDGDSAWPELRPRRGDIIEAPEMWHLAALEGGMSSGAVSLTLRLDVGVIDYRRNDRFVIAQTSLAAWIAATAALRGRFPEAFRDGPLDSGCPHNPHCPICREER